MPLKIKLDPDRANPLYRQIADQTAAAIAAGTLAPGERLPTVRDLADRLEITRLTVHKGYRELQGQGLVEATVGRGTFVTERAAAGATAATTGGGTGRQELTADAVMADIQKYGAEADMTNLAHAEPDPALIPAEAFWEDTGL